MWAIWGTFWWKSGIGWDTSISSAHFVTLGPSCIFCPESEIVRTLSESSPTSWSMSFESDLTTSSFLSLLWLSTFLVESESTLDQMPSSSLSLSVKNDAKLTMTSLATSVVLTASTFDVSPKLIPLSNPGQKIQFYFPSIGNLMLVRSLIYF